jgi:hypothetical protein
MKGKLFPEVCFLSCLMLLQGCATAAPTSTNQTSFQLTIELQDGSKIIGKSGDNTFQFRSDVLGEIKLPLEKIRSIECQPKTNSAKLATVNGDTLAVQFAMKEVRVEAAFGNFKLPVNLIKRMAVRSMDRSGRIRPGLVVFWSADGNADDLLNGNNGVLCNETTFVPGKIGQAFSFNGVNSFVKVPQSPGLNLADQITIAFWMKADADNPMNTYQGLVSSDFYIMEISNGYGGRMGVNLCLSTTANPSAEWNGSRMGITTVANYSHISQANGGGAPVTCGEWHHIAGTYDGMKLQLYVDGRPWGNPVRHTGTILPMLSKSFVTIGSEDGRTTCPDCVANRYFKGLIDEVAIYNRALSAAEIQAICVEENNDELPPPTPSPGIRRFGGEYLDRLGN